MPTTKNNNKAGTPKRYPVLLTTILINNNIEPINRIFSAVKIITVILYGKQR